MDIPTQVPVFWRFHRYRYTICQKFHRYRYWRSQNSIYSGTSWRYLSRGQVSSETWTHLYIQEYMLKTHFDTTHSMSIEVSLEFLVPIERLFGLELWYLGPIWIPKSM